MPLVSCLWRDGSRVLVRSVHYAPVALKPGLSKILARYIVCGRCWDVAELRHGSYGRGSQLVDPHQPR